MGRVVVLGSLNVDLVTHVERHPGRARRCSAAGVARLAGGKGANQAVAAARPGPRSLMVGCGRRRRGGRAYVERLRALGVDVPGSSYQ